MSKALRRAEAPTGAEAAPAGAVSPTSPVALPAGSRSQGGLTTTQHIFKELEERGVGQQATGAGGATTYAALQRMDAMWHDVRTRTAWGPRPEFVRTTADALLGAGRLDADVVVCGGTLGIFLACAWQLAGLRVAVVEAGPLSGRAQVRTSICSSSRFMSTGPLHHIEQLHAPAQWLFARLRHLSGLPHWHLRVPPSPGVERQPQRTLGAGGRRSPHCG